MIIAPQILKNIVHFFELRHYGRSFLLNMNLVICSGLFWKDTHTIVNSGFLCGKGKSGEGRKSFFFFIFYIFLYHWNIYCAQVCILFYNNKH